MSKGEEGRALGNPGDDGVGELASLASLHIGKDAENILSSLLPASPQNPELTPLSF